MEAAISSHLQCQSLRLGYRTLLDILMTPPFFLNGATEFLGEFSMGIVGDTYDYTKTKVETLLLEGIWLALSFPIMILCTICT